MELIFIMKSGNIVWPLAGFAAATVMIVCGGLWLGFLNDSQEAYLHLLLPHLRKQPTISGTPLSGGASARHFLDTLECFSSSGKWVFNCTPRPLAWNIAGDAAANVCEEHHLSKQGSVAGFEADLIASTWPTVSENWTVRNELKWVWRTSSQSCPWVPFDHEQMCRLIGNRNVLLVGDSINHELQWTFVNHLHKKGVYALLQPVKGKVAACRRCISEPLCGDVLGGQGFQIGFIRNDRLSLRLDVVEDLHKDVIEWAWLPYLNTWDVEILILNRGAHYEEDHRYIEALSKLFRLLHRDFPKLLVIYRNTPPGMVGKGDCWPGVHGVANYVVSLL